MPNRAFASHSGPPFPWWAFSCSALFHLVALTGFLLVDKTHSQIGSPDVLIVSLPPPADLSAPALDSFSAAEILEQPPEQRETSTDQAPPMTVPAAELAGGQAGDGASEDLLSGGLPEIITRTARPIVMNKLAEPGVFDRTDTGSVVLQLRINASGRVVALRLESSTVPTKFLTHVLRAFQGALYSPGESYGVPVESTLRVEIRLLDGSANVVAE